MYKVCGSIELSIDDIKDCIQGSQLLSSIFSADRAREGKCPVHVDENYFVRYAIKQCLDDLKQESKTFSEN